MGFVLKQVHFENRSFIQGVARSGLSGAQRLSASSNESLRFPQLVAAAEVSPHHFKHVFSFQFISVRVPIDYSPIVAELLCFSTIKYLEQCRP